MQLVTAITNVVIVKNSINWTIWKFSTQKLPNGLMLFKRTTKRSVQILVTTLSAVRMAERSKALRSGRSPVLRAWVRIPLLTIFFGVPQKNFFFCIGVELIVLILIPVFISHDLQQSVLSSASKKALWRLSRWLVVYNGALKWILNYSL